MPEPRVVTVEGARRRVLEEGPGGGTPLLLLHGGLGSAEDLAALRPLLAPAPTYARMAADTVAVCAELGIAERAC